jgi:P-type Ca2+ transporter type 2C
MPKKVSAISRTASNATAAAPVKVVKGAKAEAMIEDGRRTGLTSEEAAVRLAEDGPNELPRAGRRSIWRIAFEVLREPMLALLLAGGIAYLLLGDLTEALILLAFATFSVAVTVIQESRTEHVLEALRDLSTPRALVIRDGARIYIAGRDVVRDDLIRGILASQQNCR